MRHCQNCKWYLFDGIKHRCSHYKCLRPVLSTANEVVHEFGFAVIARSQQGKCMLKGRLYEPRSAAFRPAKGKISSVIEKIKHFLCR